MTDESPTVPTQIGDQHTIDAELLDLDDTNNVALRIAAVAADGALPYLEIGVVRRRLDDGVYAAVDPASILTIEEGLTAMVALRHVVPSTITAILSTPKEAILGEISSGCFIADGKWVRVLAVGNTPGEIRLQLDRGGSPEEILAYLPFRLCMPFWSALERIALAALSARENRWETSDEAVTRDAVHHMAMIVAHADPDAPELVH